MIKYLKELLYDLKLQKAEKDLQNKIWALETAIEILEKLRNNRGGKM